MAKKYGALDSSNNIELWKVKVRDQSEPYVVKVEKVGGDWIEAEEKGGFIGILTDFKLDGYEYRGEWQDTVEMIFDIGDGVNAKVQCNLNGIAKNMINCFTNAQENGKGIAGHEVMFRVYEKDGYARVYIEIDGEKASWFLTPAQVKKIAKIDSKWVDMAKKYLIPVFEEYNLEKKDDVESHDDFPTVDAEDADVVEDDDDLPF